MEADVEFRERTADKTSKPKKLEEQMLKRFIFARLT